MTPEELARLKAIADQRRAAYEARRQGNEDSPALQRFAELERQARQAYQEALAQWDRQQAGQA